MIGYGQAFVAGWLFFVAMRVILERRSGQPWDYAPMLWGIVFMCLNFVSIL